MKKIFFGALLSFVLVALPVQAKTVAFLFGAAKTNSTSAVLTVNTQPRTIYATISGSGAVSATVTCYGSNINSATAGITVATLSLTGTGSDAKGAEVTGGWPFVWCTITSITGTSAAVSTTIAY